MKTVVTVDVESWAAGGIEAVLATARVEGREVAWAREMNAGAAVRMCMQQARIALDGQGLLSWRLPFCGRTFDVAWWEQPARRPNLKQMARLRKHAHHAPTPPAAKGEP